MKTQMRTTASVGDKNGYESYDKKERIVREHCSEVRLQMKKRNNCCAVTDHILCEQSILPKRRRRRGAGRGGRE